MNFPNMLIHVIFTCRAENATGNRARMARLCDTMACPPMSGKIRSKGEAFWANLTFEGLSMCFEMLTSTVYVSSQK